MRALYRTFVPKVHARQTFRGPLARPRSNTVPSPWGGNDEFPAARGHGTDSSAPFKFWVRCSGADMSLCFHPIPPELKSSFHDQPTALQNASLSFTGIMEGREAPQAAPYWLPMVTIAFDDRDAYARTICTTHESILLHWSAEHGLCHF